MSDSEIERLRRERDAYRLLAVNEGWSWPMVRAYGHAAYLKHRIEEVDARAARTVASGYAADRYLAAGLKSA